MPKMLFFLHCNTFLRIGDFFPGKTTKKLPIRQLTRIYWLMYAYIGLSLAGSGLRVIGCSNYNIFRSRCMRLVSLRMTNRKR